MSYVNQTLSNIPLGQILGASTGAVIQAQALAAATTIDFIKEVGLTEKTTGSGTSATTAYEAKYVTFTYEEQVPSGSGNSTTLSKTLRVPVLAIVEPPSLEIQKFELDFTANIQEMSSVQVDQSISTEVDASLSVGFRFPRGKVNLKASVAHDRSRKTQTSSNRSTEYTMDISLTARQAKPTTGLLKVLSIMESAISN